MVKHQQKTENPSDDSVGLRSSSVRDGAIPSSRSSAAGRFGKGEAPEPRKKGPWLVGLYRGYYPVVQGL